MLFVVVFMALLSLLIFIGFMLINKSQLEISEKLTGKIVILTLFTLVILIN